MLIIFIIFAENFKVMTSQASLIQELRENLRNLPAGQRGAMIAKTIGLNNRPDVISSERQAIEIAKNQARTTRQSVEVLQFIEMPSVFAVAATNKDAGAMKRAGFRQYTTVDANGGTYQTKK